MPEQTGITPLRCDGHSHIFYNCATRCQCGERTHPATENGAAPMMVVGQVTLTPPPYTLEPVMVPRHIVMEFCRLGCQIAGAQDGDPLDWPKLIAAIDRLRHSAPISPPSPAETPTRAGENEIDTTNTFLVSAHRAKISFLRPVPPTLTHDEALLLAAYLVAMVGDDERWDAVRKAVENA